MARKNKQTVSTTAIQGNVKIKIKQGKRTVKTYNVHNTGTLNLFYGLVTALGGNVDTRRLPRYISVGYGLLEDNPGANPLTLSGLLAEDEKLATKRPLVQANFKGPSVGSSSVSTTYQGIIPYSDIKGDNNNHKIIKEIGLFGTQDTNSLVARVEINSTDELTAGQNFIVEWTFDIKNA